MQKVRQDIVFSNVKLLFAHTNGKKAKTRMLKQVLVFFCLALKRAD